MPSRTKDVAGKEEMVEEGGSTPGLPVDRGWAWVVLVCKYIKHIIGAGTLR